MEPSVVLSDPGLDAVRRRRVSLRAAMNGLEDALATPATGRALVWGEQAHAAAEEVQRHLREHIDTTEGPQGFHAEMLAAAPRLSHAVSVLTHDHVVATSLVGTLISRSADVATDEQVEQVRDIGTDLLSKLSRHRQRGADLIYEAYEYDLGGED
jgi:hypothetical protein